MAPWQKRASGSLLAAQLPGLSSDHNHHPTPPQIIPMPKGTRAHKAWGAELFEPRAYGLGRKWASPSLCPRPSALLGAPKSRHPTACCPDKLAISSHLSQESMSILVGKRVHGPKVLPGRLQKEEAIILWKRHSEAPSRRQEERWQIDESIK